MKTRADQLAEQITVLFGWCPTHAETEREKALNQLWHEWAEERGGYLAEHRDLNDERIAELARQHDERRATAKAAIDKLVVEVQP